MSPSNDSYSRFFTGGCLYRDTAFTRVFTFCPACRGKWCKFCLAWPLLAWRQRISVGNTVGPGTPRSKTLSTRTTIDSRRPCVSPSESCSDHSNVRLGLPALRYHCSGSRMNSSLRASFCPRYTQCSGCPISRDTRFAASAAAFSQSLMVVFVFGGKDGCNHAQVPKMLCT